MQHDGFRSAQPIPRAETLTHDDLNIIEPGSTVGQLSRRNTGRLSQSPRVWAICNTQPQTSSTSGNWPGSRQTRLSFRAKVSRDCCSRLQGHRAGDCGTGLPVVRARDAGKWEDGVTPPGGERGGERQASMRVHPCGSTCDLTCDLSRGSTWERHSGGARSGRLRQACSPQAFSPQAC